jgi:hypothetical protein
MCLDVTYALFKRVSVSFYYKFDVVFRLRVAQQAVSFAATMQAINALARKQPSDVIQLKDTRWSNNGPFPLIPPTPPLPSPPPPPFTVILNQYHSLFQLIDVVVKIKSALKIFFYNIVSDCSLIYQNIMPIYIYQQYTFSKPFAAMMQAIA